MNNSYSKNRPSRPTRTGEKPLRTNRLKRDDDRPPRRFTKRDDEKPVRSSRLKRDDDRPAPRFPKRNDDKPVRTNRFKRDDDRPTPRFPKRDDEKPVRTNRFKRDDDRPTSRFPKRNDERPARTNSFKRDDDRPTSRFPKRNDERPARTNSFKRDDDRPAPRFPKRNDDKPVRTNRFKRDDDRPAPRFAKRDEAQPARRSRPSYNDEKPFRSRPVRNEEEHPRRIGAPTGTARKYRTVTAAPSRKPVKRKTENEELRLNKFIANSGICSRREADEYITAGLVSVNGSVITELGVKVKPTDDIRFNGERMKGEQKAYIVMNKPKDYVTTTSDPHAENTVMDLIGSKCPQRVFPVGRLDRNTTGVLIFTNDGDLAEQLTHPSHNKKKVYHVFLDKNLKQTDLKKLVEGITLEDGLAQADLVSYVDGDRTQVGFEIHSGRNRIVRRMFEYLGYKVKKLDRVYFAGITKKNLKRGQWRFLTEQEITMLRMGAYE